jgi:uncharacterized protein (TIGR03083 family)
MSETSLPPVDAVHLIREVDEALIVLLREIAPGDWQKSAVGEWSVRDVAAHLLDGALRRLSLDRDGHQPPAPDRDVGDYSELVIYLNELNGDWIRAARRLGPEVITDLLAHACPQMADYFESLDPEAPAAFPVSWAGETQSKVWMDTAREFTERWHHQQQIRDAVGIPGVTGERYLRPLLETLIRALPRSYASLESPAGTRVGIRVTDLDTLRWCLEKGSSGWQLGAWRQDRPPDTTIELSSEILWRLLTKGAPVSVAREQTRVRGERELSEPFFSTLGIMA